MEKRTQTEWVPINDIRQVCDLLTGPFNCFVILPIFPCISVANDPDSHTKYYRYVDICRYVSHYTLCIQMEGPSRLGPVGMCMILIYRMSIHESCTLDPIYKWAEISIVLLQ